MGTSPAPSQHQSVESYLSAVEELLRQIVLHGKFDLKWKVRQVAPGENAAGSPAYVLEFSGPDQDLLLEKNAALLDALESVVFKAVRLDEDLFGKITLDCRGYRDMRVQELKLMAQVAADRVIESGDPFTLNPMNARERRIVHLALKDQPKVRTQSEGFGPERKVVIVPAAN